jgi:drug/metabolite transporter (DMT)-like permease
VSFDDWILALHILSAFALVAALVLFWVLIVAVRRTDTPEGTLRMGPLGKIGNVAAGIGGIGTIVFGIWLAFSVGDYDIWDFWIIAALVLWALATGAGARTGKEYMAGMVKAQELQASGQTEPSAELLATFTLLILIDMIWKPGA